MQDIAGYTFSAKGATLTSACGNAPGNMAPKTRPALKARFTSKNQFVFGVEKSSIGLERAFSAWSWTGNRILGRCPRLAYGNRAVGAKLDGRDALPRVKPEALLHHSVTSSSCAPSTSTVWSVLRSRARAM